LVLLYRGEGFTGPFSIIPFENGELTARGERPLRLDDYQYLTFLSSLPLSHPNGPAGIFWEPSVSDRLRVFLLELTGRVTSFLLPSLRPGDASRELLSVWPLGQGGYRGFYRTRYGIQAFDTVTSRFSAADPRAHEARTLHLPGAHASLVLPEQAGANLTAEVLFAEDGIRKPAHYKTVGVRGCEAIDSSPADSAPIERLRYRCGETFISLPLQPMNAEDRAAGGLFRAEP
jgi:hypothetical protein